MVLTLKCQTSTPIKNRGSYLNPCNLKNKGSCLKISNLSSPTVFKDLVYVLKAPAHFKSTGKKANQSSGSS